jgi:GH18 family chitinase
LYRALRKELDAAGTEDNTHYTLSIAVVSGYDKIVAGEL